MCSTKHVLSFKRWQFAPNFANLEKKSKNYSRTEPGCKSGTGGCGEDMNYDVHQPLSGMFGTNPVPIHLEMNVPCCLLDAVDYNKCNNFNCKSSFVRTKRLVEPYVLLVTHKSKGSKCFPTAQKHFGALSSFLARNNSFLV